MAYTKRKKENKKEKHTRGRTTVYTAVRAPVPNQKYATPY
jgi:hypothetical protein